MDIPPRAFDPSVFNLPFTLPAYHVVRDDEDDNLMPYSGLVLGRADAHTHTHSHAPTHTVVPYRVTHVCERTHTRDGVDPATDMGIAGGIGSGSSLGSRIRSLPSSKYRDGPGMGVAPEGGNMPLFRTLSQESVGAHTHMVTEPEVVAKDLAVIDRAPGSEAYLRTRLKELHAGLTPETAAAPVDEADDILWWLTCPYTRAVMRDAEKGKKLREETQRQADGGDVETMRGDGAAAVRHAGDALAGITGPTALVYARPAGAAADAELPSDAAISTTAASAAAADARPPATDASTLSPARVRHEAPRSRPSPGGRGVSAMAAGFLADDDEADLVAAHGLAAVYAAESAARKGAGAAVVSALSRSIATEEAAASSAASASRIGGISLAPFALPGSAAGAPSAVPPAPLPSLPARERSAPPAVDLPASLDGIHRSVSTLEATEAPAGADDEFDSVVTKLLTSQVDTGAQPDRRGRHALTGRLGGGLPRVNDAERRWAVASRMTEAEMTAAEGTFTPVLTWPFRLDAFQRQAIIHMERDGADAAIFVAAHTSAGKTLVAEYAIALSMAHRARAVYTSPIKALSNQKFNDLRARFGGKDGKGVGIITGDVTVNPDAPCLIMTTEILRSMLYRGDELIRDIEWVIFDEIHYMNDEERGLAYEEVLLLLPDDIGLIFLSATLPNKEEFAEWVGRTKQKPVYVLGTTKRPVPLNHFLFVDNALHLIMDGAQVDTDGHLGWKDANYRGAAEKLAARLAKRGGAALYGAPRNAAAGRGGGGRTKADTTMWNQVLQTLQKQDLLPAIIFGFSKAKVEECAYDGLSSSVLTTARERGVIHGFLENAVRRLSGTDRTLPQIQRLRTLLSRGIGVHHAGLLPIMKECVELLFARGLVKVLFTTETFAMGINMPARCVVFNGVRKHDGTRWRELTASEYTQMAGRAGRRGLDTRGNVIILNWGDALLDQPTLRNMMMGKPTKLTSQFRLTYNMILNVLRTDIPVTQMMAKSYAEFATQAALGGSDIPRLLARGAKRLQALQEAADSIPCIRDEKGDTDDEIVDIEEINSGVDADVVYRHAPAIQQYFDAALEAQRQHMLLMRKIIVPRTMSQILCPGRLVILDFVATPAASVATITDASGTDATAASPAEPARLQRAPSGGSLISLATSEASGGASGTASDAMLYNVPAVILSAETVPHRPGASEDERVDVRINVAVLCPPWFSQETAAPAEHPAGPVTAPPSAAHTAMVAHAAEEGVVLVQRKRDDDDVDAFMFGSGGKGKGKGKGGARAPSSASAPPAAAKAVVSEPQAPASRDWCVTLGLFRKLELTSSSSMQAAPSGGGAKGARAVRPAATREPDVSSEDHRPSAMHRVVGVVQIRFNQLARITNVVLPGTPEQPRLDASLSGVLTGHGSLNALSRVASALWGALASSDADLPIPGQIGGRGLEERGFTRAVFRLPPLNPATDIKPADLRVDVVEMARYVTTLEDSLTSSKCYGCPRFDRHWNAHRRVRRLQAQLAAVRARFSIEALALYPEMQARFQILRRLGYTKPAADAESEVSPAAVAPMDGSVPTGLDVVALKGRVAAEVNTCDELIFTEMIFDGVLNDLNPAESAALLSALVFQDRSSRGEGIPSAAVPLASADAGPAAPGVGEDAVEEDEEAASAAGASTDAASEADRLPVTPHEASTESASAGAAADASAPPSPQSEIPGEEIHLEGYAGPSITSITPALEAACHRLHTIALSLGRLQMDAGLPIVPSEFARAKLNFGLLMATYAWACGVPFRDVTDLTQAQEGIIVRTITRLDETCREVRNAARIIGDPLLYRKMEAASSYIKRDVIFATSLYIA